MKSFKKQFPSLAREIIGGSLKDTNEEWRLQVSNSCKDNKIISQAIKSLQNIQLESGSKDNYGHGLYNGMELIKATLLKLEPCFLSKEEFKRKHK